MPFTPVFPLQRPISYLPQSKLAQVGKWRNSARKYTWEKIRAKTRQLLLRVMCIGRPPDEEVVSCTHYDDVQLPLWEKLAEERIRMNQAKRKFSSEQKWCINNYFIPLYYLHVHGNLYWPPDYDTSVAMTTVEIKKKWQKWDEVTIDSYRLQFRVIDINEDGLIDFHEL